MHTSGLSLYISYIDRNDPDATLPSLASGAGQGWGHGKGVYGSITQSLKPKFVRQGMSLLATFLTILNASM